MMAHYGTTLATYRGHPEPQVREPLARLDSLAVLVLLVHKVSLEPQVHKAILVLLEAEPLEPLAHKDPEAHRDFQVRKDPQVPQDHKDHKDLKEPQDPEVRKDPLVRKDPQDQQGHKDLPGQLDQQGHKDLPGQLDCSEQPD
jgi:hypothetical protein